MWEKCKELQDYIVSLRRDLHKIPEVGFDLPETQAYIAAELDRLGISYKKNQKDSGIIGEIQGGQPGKTVLLLLSLIHICLRPGYRGSDPGGDTRPERTLPAGAGVFDVLRPGGRPDADLCRPGGQRAHCLPAAPGKSDGGLKPAKRRRKGI